MEFSFFVLPTNFGGHSTHSLAQQFSLGDIPHRAVEDCKLEFKIIEKLCEEYEKKPKKHREALLYSARRIQWWWANLLTGDAKPVERISELVAAHIPYRKEKTNQEILTFKTQKISLNEVEKKFDYTEKSSDTNGYSEDRPEQKKMANLIASAFNENKHIVIEAGTGTGKSKAYLVPSLLFALQNGIPVIISTHTKALQDQLFLKEIPHIKNIIDPNLRVALLKGKKNYVCLQKFEEFEDEIMNSLSQRSLYEFGKMNTQFTSPLAYLFLSSWIITTERGDWDELPYWFKERIPKKIELEVCNFDELCHKETCELYDAQKCFLAKARLRARDADLVIVNHALALSGIILEGEQSENSAEQKQEKKYSHTIFPGEAKFIVFDEAHHLEDDATSAWEYSISRNILELVLQQLYSKNRGAISLLERIFQDVNNKRLNTLLKSFEEKEDDFKLIIHTLFDVILPEFVSNVNEEQPTTYSLFNDIAEKKSIFDTLTNLKFILQDITNTLKIFTEESRDSKARKILTVRINTIQKIIDSLTIAVGDDKNYVKYLERSNNGIEIKAAPLSVAPLLKEYVYDNFSSVILTSATLTVNKSFNFFSSRCGTIFIPQDKISYQVLSSSFDYDKQVKFFLPKGISCGDNKKIHFEKSIEFLEKAITASNGGALILCTSHKQINMLYEKLEKPLAQHGIWLLRQSKGSVSSVIKDFKSDIDSVLIGTESLWKGIDVPGPSLRSLFIYKIPYRMPNLPILRARRQELDDMGRKSFVEYYEPLAAIALKQGFGRLIRKSTDTGIAVLLDERLMDKPRLLNSLPDGVHPQKVEAEDIYNHLRELAKSIAIKN
jgi:ATP-dependent DNA helicase DinG